MTVVIDRTATDPKTPAVDGLAVRAALAKDHIFDLFGDRETRMCVLPFRTPVHGVDGAFRLCSSGSTAPYPREKVMGFYQDAGSAAVWSGEKYRHIRKTLMTGQDLEPYCGACTYRFTGPAWMLQLHLALFSHANGAGSDLEVQGMIRRWASRYPEYAGRANSLGLELMPMAEIPVEGPLNEGLPEAIVSSASLPVYIDFNTLNRCNVSCTMCPPAVRHDDNGQARDPYYRLGPEEFDRICEGVNVKSVHFVGNYAEPLLNKDIFALVRRAHEQGAFTAITSNATVLIPQFAERLLDSGLQMMTVSLHGATKATAERIMRKADFDRVIGNVRAVQFEKARRGTQLPEIYFNFVSQRDNIDELADFIDLAAELGVRHVQVVNLITGSLADKSGDLTQEPERVGPAVADARRRAALRGVNVYVSPAYTAAAEAWDAALARQVPPHAEARQFHYDLTSFERVRDHVLRVVDEQVPGETPFRHLFIRGILPDDLYTALDAHRRSVRALGDFQARDQDSPAFTNRKFHLFEVSHPVIDCIRDVFDDPAVKTAFVGKFFLDPSRDVVDQMAIHREFEYVLTEPDRFQEIHVDVPSKFVSFVFYLPDDELEPDEACRNATVLYDKELQEHYPASLERNSVCVFAPHFFSYHGFASTIARDVMVMFYIHRGEAERYLEVVFPDTPPFTGFLDAVEGKLRRYPLIEYGASENRLLYERAGCRINAPNGRVRRDVEAASAGPSMAAPVRARV